MFQLIFVFGTSMGLTTIVIEEPYQSIALCQTAAIIAFQGRNWHDNISGSSMCVPLQHSQEKDHEANV